MPAPSTVAVDLRADDHEAPVGELKRLFTLHRLYFPRPEDMEFVDVDEALAAELRERLTALGYDPGGGSGYTQELRDALWAYVGTENLEERWTEDPTIERGILDFVRQIPPR